MLKQSIKSSIDAQDARYAAIVSDLDDETLARVQRSIVDLATGLTRIIAVPRGKGSAFLPEATWNEAFVNGVPVETVTAYVTPPDPAAIRMIMEFNLGRPGQRDMGRKDPVIRIHTTVPMPWELATRADGSPREKRIDDELHEVTLDGMAEVADQMSREFDIDQHKEESFGSVNLLADFDLDEFEKALQE